MGFRLRDLVLEVGFYAGLMFKIRVVFAYLVRNVSWMDIGFEFYNPRLGEHAIEVAGMEIRLANVAINEGLRHGKRYCKAVGCE